MSVAIPTYNGGRHIAALLASIACQSVPVDEVVLSDDGSGDDTLEAARAALAGTPIRLGVVANQARHGPTGNYVNAIAHCSGDIIFLADQDDVWTVDRCRRYLEHFQDPRVSLVAANSLIVDENLRPMGASWWRRDPARWGPRTLSTRGRPRHLLRPSVLAHQMAFRSRCRDEVAQIAGEFMIEDWCRWACEMDGHAILDFTPLTLYRQHPQQHTQASRPMATGSTVHRLTVGPQSAALLSALEAQRRNVAAACRRFRRHQERPGNGDAADLALKIRFIERLLAYQQRRIDFYRALARRRSLPRALALHGRMLSSDYFPCGNGIRTLLKDSLALGRACFRPEGSP
ncbi:MAG: hypothetical protein ER33_03620 [Cyanobium sp. CACIAM 14]|nr:MAG: hypothetical protein ER33_03620 [Cyanobium sp. CACIAM 14]